MPGLVTLKNEPPLTTSSHRWKCQVAKTRNLGHAGKSQMVFITDMSVIHSSYIMFRDAWEKHKGLPSYQAKLLYVETLLRVCATIIVFR